MANTVAVNGLHAHGITPNALGVYGALCGAFTISLVNK
jgi:hypothetical protein